MATSVHYHLEQMLPELQDFEKRGIFNRVEIKAIVKKRTALEYAIHRRIALKQDFLKYIEYELNLEQLRRKRKERLGLDKVVQVVDNKGKKQGKGSVSDYSIIRRVHALYAKALKKFGADIELWVQYFEWCQELSSSKALSTHFARAIQLHPNVPTFWIMSAKYEFEKNGNVNSARILLQRALRLNPECQKLWLEYFKLELLFIEKIKERRRILLPEQEQESVKEQEEMEEDASINLPELQQEQGLVTSELQKNATIKASLTELEASNKVIQEYAIPRVVVKQAIKAIPDDMSFRVDFIHIYSKFGKDTDVGRKEVYASLLHDFGTKASARAIVSRRFLMDVQGVQDPEYPMALKQCIQAFALQTEELDTKEMWEECIAFLVEQLKAVDEENLTCFLCRVLESTWSKAQAESRMSIQSYLYYIDYTKNKDPDAVSSLCQEALDVFPESVALWSTHLHHLHDQVTTSLTAPSVSLFEGTVKQALEAPVAQSELGRWMIWNVYIQFLVSMHHNKIQGYETNSLHSSFQRLLSECRLNKQNENKLFILYVQWASEWDTIETVRSIYTRWMQAKPITLECILCCLSIEKKQSSLDAHCMDRLFNMAVDIEPLQQDVWLDWIRYCIQQGDIHKASQVHWKASKHHPQFPTMASLNTE